MRCSHKFVAVFLLPVMLVASPAMAQQARIADAAVLQQALAAQSASEDGQRDLVRRVLQRDEVQTIAAQMGLDIGQASTAVATLSGADLAAAAHQAQTAQDALAGGSTTIVISVTTLLLILIIVILLAK